MAIDDLYVMAPNVVGLFLVARKEAGVGGAGGGGGEGNTVAPIAVEHPCEKRRLREVGGDVSRVVLDFHTLTLHLGPPRPCRDACR